VNVDRAPLHGAVRWMTLSGDRRLDGDFFNATASPPMASSAHGGTSVEEKRKHGGVE
jgi:hypothetical protein